MVTVRSIVANDSESWLQMRTALWPESPRAEHRDEITRFFAGRPLRPPCVVLVAETSDQHVVGFVELSIRPYAEGCVTNRVAYLEGWYVLPEYRTRGVGRALVAAAENWGRAEGCIEFASDAEPDNDVSSIAHRALGFEDVGLVRCFAKKL